LLGKTLVKIEQNNKDAFDDHLDFFTSNDDHLDFFTSNDECFRMYHKQICCESVYIEDICSDLDDLLNSPLTMAEEITNADDKALDKYADSFTWTYYKLATVKGYVTIRWYGTSNGYYSESVDFVEVS